MKRVFIIHGWEATPESNWFPWLKKELENNDFEVVVPAMPNSAFPVLKDWLLHLRKEVGEVDENTYFVGHSLGPIMILKFLETFLSGEKAGGVFMVAGFSESLGIIETENFFEKELDYEKVKTKANKFVAINSDNDPYVPLYFGEVLRDKLGAKFIVVKNGMHLNAGDGNFTLPIVLEKILEAINKI